MATLQEAKGSIHKLRRWEKLKVCSRRGVGGREQEHDGGLESRWERGEGGGGVKGGERSGCFLDLGCVGMGWDGLGWFGMGWDGSEQRGAFPLKIGLRFIRTI